MKKAGWFLKFGFAVAASAMTGGAFARTVEMTGIENGVATLAFGDADDKTYTLVMASGDADQGANFDAWKSTRVIGTVAADETTREVALGDENFVRFFLREDDPTLPFAKKLLYVESNGKQYVNTGITGKSGVGVVFDMSWTAVADKTAIGSKSSDGKRFFLIHGTNARAQSVGDNVWRDRWCLGYNGFIYGYTYMADGVDAVYHVESKLAKNDFVVKVDGVDYVVSGSYSPNQTVDTAIPMYIFGANVNGVAGQQSSMRLYRGKIYDNGVLQRDYIPCELANGKGALYDLVSQQVFQNLGSADLTKGPEDDFPQRTAACSETMRSNQDARLIGRWNFNGYDPANPTSTNILRAAAGRDAIPCYYAGAGTAPITDGTIGGMYVVSSGLAKGEYALAIPRYHHLKLPFPEGGIDNRPWTMKIKLFSPASVAGKWRAIYSRNLANNTDGSMFINQNNKLGFLNDGWGKNYETEFTSDVWHTLTLSGGDERRDMFLDETTEAVWKKEDAFSWFNGKDGLLLCADDTEADGVVLYIASVEIWTTGGALEGRLSHYTRAGLTGEWTFPAADPLAASKGRNLEKRFRKLNPAYSAVNDGVAEGDTGLKCGLYSGLRCQHGLEPESDYTVVMDVRMPANSELNKLHALFHAGPGVDGDANAYLKCVGSDDVRLWLASGTWTENPVCRAGEWIRFVMTYVNATSNRFDYVNGVKIDKREDGRMKVRGDDFFFLVDNDGESYPLDISYAAVYDHAFTEAEVGELLSRPAVHDADCKFVPQIAPVKVWEGSPLKTGDGLAFNGSEYVWTRETAPSAATYVFDFETRANFDGGLLVQNDNAYGTAIYPAGNLASAETNTLTTAYSGGKNWGYWTYDCLPLGERHRVAVTWSAAGHVLYYLDGDPVAQIAPYNANNAMTPTAVMRFLTDAEVKVTRIAAYDTVLTPVEVKLLGGPGEVVSTGTLILVR